GEPVLRLKDPDGIIVKLVGEAGVQPVDPWPAPGIAAADAILRIRGATIFSEKPEDTAAFLARHFGFRPVAAANGIRRLASDVADILDIRDAAGFWTSAPGTGTIDHIALRAPDRDTVERAGTVLQAEGAGD